MNTAAALAGLVALIVSSASPSFAEPYAPLLDASGKGNSYLEHKIRSAKVPPKAEVPVPAYKPASIFAVSKISSSGEGKFQDNRIVHLSSTDSEDDVVAFYKKSLSGWKFRAQKRNKVFLKEGEQYFWGGNKVLKAPRVEVVDLANPGSLSSVDTMKLKQSFPEMKTLIKVFYEKSSEAQLAVDVNKVMSRCIDYEVRSKSKLMGRASDKPESQNYLRKMAQSSCQRVKKACDRGSNDRFCQKYARKYTQ